MPGPGKRKSKSKRPSAGAAGGRDLSNVDIPTVLDGFIDEINDTRDWEAVIAILCRMFDLPDLHSRSGLKKIHVNFPEVQRNLTSAYNKYRGAGNPKVTGGIVGIWAAMCMDAILRNKLFKEGIMDKIVPLFDERSTRVVALQALSTITHHGGSEIRREIAQQIPTLIRLMEEFPDDMTVNELVTVTLAHTLSAVANDEDSPLPVQKKNMSKMDITAALRLLLRNLKHPKVPHALVTHGLLLLASIAHTCGKEMRSIPAINSLLIACLRSHHLTTRCNALGALFRSVLDVAEDDIRGMDPHKLIQCAQRGFPSELSDALMSGDPSQSDVYLTLRSSAEFQRAMMKCAQDHDLYSLGQIQAELIVRTEFSVAEGAFQSQNPTTGQLEFIDIGLPFKMWGDSLPHCAKALRATGTLSDLDKADILDCKFYIMRQRSPDALRLAQNALQRSPQVAYFYYVIGLSTTDLAEGLRACKKGLKCKQITPFVRRYMLWRATCHAADLGLTALSDSGHAGDTQYAEGVAFLISSMEDANAFVKEASPDNRHMPEMINWYILLAAGIKGPELSLDLREIDYAFKKLELAHKFGKFLQMPQPPTQVRMTFDLVTKQYKSAIAEWQSVIARMDKLQSSDKEVQAKTSQKADDNLSAWLDGLKIDGEQEDDCKMHAVPSKLSTTIVSLYRCTYCSNPSAALRKCSGCGKTRYCDAGCQKQHWSEHRVACKAAQAEN